MSFYHRSFVGRAYSREDQVQILPTTEVTIESQLIAEQLSCLRSTRLLIVSGSNIETALARATRHPIRAASAERVYSHELERARRKSGPVLARFLLGVQFFPK